MKKQILTVAVAALALAGCSKSETVEVAGNRAIGFNSFVNKNTRAVKTIDDASALGTNFYVFGRYGTAPSPDWNGIAFDNEISTAVYYWQAGKTYCFGAYANGANRANGKINDATFDAGTQTLTFPGYTPDDTKDLVAAVAGNIAANDHNSLPSGTPVELNFKHLLSQVKLTFTTDAAATYNMTITDVKIEGAVSTADGKYNGTATWTKKATEGYTYEEFGTTAEGGKVISSGVPADQVKFVIPQGNTNGLKVTFTATLKGTEATGTATFEATLEHALSTANTWMPQYCYNYTANVPLEKVIENPEGKVKITFNPSLDPWEDLRNTDIPSLTERP